MNLSEEVIRKLPALLHVIMTVLTIPYLLLAGFYLMIGRMASQRGLWAILDSFLESLNWAITWGLLLMGFTVFSVGMLGVWESQRWLATLALAGLISFALSILLIYPSTTPTGGELIFLTPGFSILAYCGWRLLRH